MLVDPPRRIILHANGHNTQTGLSRGTKSLRWPGPQQPGHRRRRRVDGRLRGRIFAAPAGPPRGRRPSGCPVDRVVFWGGRRFVVAQPAGCPDFETISRKRFTSWVMSDPVSDTGAQAAGAAELGTPSHMAAEVKKSASSEAPASADAQKSTSGAERFGWSLLTEERFELHLPLLAFFVGVMAWALASNCYSNHVGWDAIAAIPTGLFELVRLVFTVIFFMVAMALVLLSLGTTAFVAFTKWPRYRQRILTALAARRVAASGRGA